MKIPIPKIRTFIIQILMGTCSLSVAADFTWNGGGADDNWTTGANWGGVAPGAAQTLVFSGTNRPTPFNNNTAGWSVFGIRFQEDAGSFALSGNSITLTSGVTNTSGNEQILDLGMTMSGNLTFNTAVGDIVSNVGIGGTSILRKEGLGTLTLKGTNTWSGGVFHLGGRVVYDHTGGGTFPTTNTFYFGTYTAPGLVLANTATLELKGTTSASLPTVNAGSYTNAANTITLDSNVTATISSMTFSGNATVNFDLTAAGSGVNFTTTPSLNEGLILRATVSDSGGTDFATVTGGTLQRFSAFDGPLVGGFASTKNYTLSGVNDIGAANINSVTITGAGSLSIAGSNGLWSRAVLMREGVGDFTFDSVLRTTVPLFVHQYSTAGTLILNGRIHDVDGSSAFNKTGPGAVQIGASSSSSYTGATNIQGGLFQLDGHLTRTATVTVFDGATLAGGGTLGATDPTALSIRAGGELAGASLASLDITGSLSFESRSDFVFTLDFAGGDFLNITGAVTLQDQVNLQLTLNGAPTPDEDRYLLRSTGGITGNFVYNGTVMTNGTAFSVGGHDFTYFQNASDIWVQAIPEPSVAGLVGLGIGLALLRRRRTMNLQGK